MMGKMQFKIVSLIVVALFYCVQANAQNMQKGKKIYEAKCLACHQADGGGVPNMNAPLDAASNVVGKDIARLVRIIRYGYNERIALDGLYYSNAMTASPDLKDNEIADLLTYIRNSWSNKASAVTIAQVQAAKKRQ
jgi:mono/diheme cytochrome c family protein